MIGDCEVCSEGCICELGSDIQRYLPFAYEGDRE
jgi:hypothetical protein